MNFSRVIGNVDPKLVSQAEEKLSKVFLELAARYDNEYIGSNLGGDPLIFTLMYPIEHVCTLNMPTAATDGKRFYWNPKFIIKTSRLGLRIICSHEAFHALYMHPHRIGSRIMKLWNIAVDFIVNNLAMEDLKARKFDPKDTFNKHLGRYMTLPQYMELLKNPFGVIKGFEDLNVQDAVNSKVKLPSPDEDRELTVQEQKELERREKAVKFFYADPDLEEDIKLPEKIYDMLYKLLPKCPKCGRVGYYKLPKKGNDKGQGQDKNKGSDKKSGGTDQDKDQDGGCCSGDSDQCQCGDQGQGGCPECGGGVDILGLGTTIDEHMDTTESEEKISKRISDAVEAAKKMAGSVPAGLEDALGLLTAPKVTWQDIIRTRLYKARAGGGRNDWTRFRTRPMFCGMMVPKKRHYYAHFGCLLDTSGSMSPDDMAFGVSQLQNLDEKAEGSLTYCDCSIYWKDTVLLKRCNTSELNTKIKPIGRGGTRLSEYFADYEKNIGKCDFIIVITDAYLDNQDLADMKNPGVPVYWLVTSSLAFKAPFGKVFSLRE